MPRGFYILSQGTFTIFFASIIVAGYEEAKMYIKFRNNFCDYPCEIGYTCVEHLGCMPSPKQEGCPDLKYGRDCEKNCSVNCAGGSCDFMYGNCKFGCIPGYTGPTCDTISRINTCPAGKWGESCGQDCKGECKDSRCNNVNGLCLHCILGKAPPLCLEACPSGKWGDDCSHPCPKCGEHYECDPYNGQCENNLQERTGVEDNFIIYLVILIACVSITLLSIPLALFLSPKEMGAPHIGGEEGSSIVQLKANDSFLVRAQERRRTMHCTPSSLHLQEPFESCSASTVLSKAEEEFKPDPMTN